MWGAKRQQAMHAMTTSAVLASMGHRVYFDGFVGDFMGPVTACARTPGLCTRHVEVGTAPSCEAGAPLHVVQLSWLVHRCCSTECAGCKRFRHVTLASNVSSWTHVAVCTFARLLLFRLQWQVKCGWLCCGCKSTYIQTRPVLVNKCIRKNSCRRSRCVRCVFGASLRQGAT